MAKPARRAWCWKSLMTRQTWNERLTKPWVREAGADDYLVKPFSAKEVLARIEAHINLARVRSETATALRIQAERLRIVQDQAPVGIYEVAMSGRFLRVNDRLCEITSYSREELLQKGFPDCQIDRCSQVVFNAESTWSGRAG